MWSDLLNVIVGISIGVTAEGWVQALAACILWGSISLYLVRSLAGKAEYKPGTRLFFGSAALTRFIVWWADSGDCLLHQCRPIHPLIRSVTWCVRAASRVYVGNRGVN